MFPDFPPRHGIGAHNAAALDLRALHNRGLETDPDVVSNNRLPGIIGDLSRFIQYPMVVRVGDAAHAGEKAAVSQCHFVSADNHGSALDNTGANI